MWQFIWVNITNSLYALAINQIIFWNCYFTSNIRSLIFSIKKVWLIKIKSQLWSLRLILFKLPFDNIFNWSRHSPFPIIWILNLLKFNNLITFFKKKIGSLSSTSLPIKKILYVFLIFLFNLINLFKIYNTFYILEYFINY